MNLQETMPRLPIHAPAHFRIIAHRGASAYAPENTLAAFELAARMGATEIETDAQLSRDGQVLLCHDDTLERYGHGAQRVESMTAAALLALDMGAWFSPFLYGGARMMTLDALFHHFGPTFIYHIEIKGSAPGLEEAVAGLVAQYDLATQTVITSFRFDALAQMHAHAPNLRLGWLVDSSDTPTLAQARQLPLFQLCPRAEFVTPAAVAAARAIVPEVRAWGLTGSRAQTLERITRVLAAGCDGMTIDWPDWVVAHAQPTEQTGATP